MYCNQCGTELGERETFCPNCGFRVVATVESAQQPPAEPNYADLPPQVLAMSMKWYKFNVNFLLWLWIVTGPLEMLSLIPACISPQEFGGVGLLVLQIFSAIAYAALSWFAWKTRKELVEYRSTAARTLRLFRIFTISAVFVFNVASACITLEPVSLVIYVFSELLSSGISFALYLICEQQYYKKRKHLFIY